MSTFTLRLDEGRGGPRVAVKDLIDMAGLPTTAGCRAVARRAGPAEGDAACLAGLRAAQARGEARIVGRTNLHELAFGINGINPWYGTPVNPLDPLRVPGGSSSGSAVAVAAGEADLGIGSDTGGSVRLPAACCGIAGLKTTWGRVPLDGVWPLAASLDTVGPLARDVAGLAQAMSLLEPGFAVSPDRPSVVGRLRLPAAPYVDQAVDGALRAAGFAVQGLGPEVLDGWAAATAPTGRLLAAEAWQAQHVLVEQDPGGIGDDVRGRLLTGGEVDAAELTAVRQVGAGWKALLDSTFARVELIALPTLLDDPPLLTEAGRMYDLRATMPVNLAGLPAVSLPIPGRRLPASLQLIGPAGSEERLLAAAAAVEAATA